MSITRAQRRTWKKAEEWAVEMYFNGIHERGISQRTRAYRQTRRAKLDAWLAEDPVRRQCFAVLLRVLEEAAQLNASYQVLPVVQSGAERIALGRFRKGQLIMSIAEKL